jgi:hypothetical protein
MHVLYCPSRFKDAITSFLLPENAWSRATQELIRLLHQGPWKTVRSLNSKQRHFPSRNEHQHQIYLHFGQNLDRQIQPFRPIGLREQILAD